MLDEFDNVCGIDTDLSLEENILQKDKKIVALQNKFKEELGGEDE